jgi:hypothetical protein
MLCVECGKKDATGEDGVCIDCFDLRYAVSNSPWCALALIARNPWWLIGRSKPGPIAKLVGFLGSAVLLFVSMAIFAVI